MTCYRSWFLVHGSWLGLGEERRTRNEERGFTVIEVLVSLSLVALLFTVLIVAVSAGMAKVREADEDTPIVAWVASAMEAAIALGVDGLPRSGSYDALSRLSAAPVLPRGVGRGILTVRQLSVKPLLKEVSVAAMRARTGQTAFTLTTIVGPRAVTAP